MLTFSVYQMPRVFRTAVTLVGESLFQIDGSSKPPNQRTGGFNDKSQENVRINVNESLNVIVIFIPGARNGFNYKLKDFIIAKLCQ